MASDTKMIKFYRHLILRPAECTQMYNLAHYEKRLDISGLDQSNFQYFPVCSTLWNLSQFCGPLCLNEDPFCIA